MKTIQARSEFEIDLDICSPGVVWVTIEGKYRVVEVKSYLPSPTMMLLHT